MRARRSPEQIRGSHDSMTPRIRSNIAGLKLNAGVSWWRMTSAYCRKKTSAAGCYWQRVSISRSDMIPDCRFARWPIGRQAAPSSVNYNYQSAVGDAERGQQSIQNTPPTTSRRVRPDAKRAPGQNNSAAEYDRKLALWEAAPVASPAFRPRPFPHADPTQLSARRPWGK
ncbi:hypothetical protein HDV63DRAFT_28245 [Trichoderma sp. SZMC 28014]